MRCKYRVKSKQANNNKTYPTPAISPNECTYNSLIANSVFFQSVRSQARTRTSAHYQLTERVRAVITARTTTHRPRMR
ncbi:hypothetical protein JYU34_006824 [Plutella xylostella]|uniref:Uncharacterized protein n=1 Tax=Plutella xylostella TaxID=51655 RepID=A0ABQ7QT21_PLUXY|nr:hypothetical protein JYU34_006824 [Plutella xylostella]